MAQRVVHSMIPFFEQGLTTATLMRRKVKMEKNGVNWKAKEMISRAAGGRMMPGTLLVMVDAGQALRKTQQTSLVKWLLVWMA